MNQLTLELPKTLHQQLKILAKDEGVQLQQYILYVLTQQVTSTYAVHVVSTKAIAQQEEAYKALRHRWAEAPISDIDEILAKREVVQPEVDLDPEVVKRLQEQIAAA